ncbi:ImcF-related family protein [Enterobacter sp. Lyrl_3]|uniref:ImcF-related family protein n=1 Tax=Enterobacter sp. Lyrl_3 TaxID=3110922 RepID=UPI003F7E6466
MSKVKVKTLIGTTVAVLFFLTVIVAFLFYAFPETMVSTTGLGPWDGQRIFTCCSLMAAIWFLVGWLTEQMFNASGKSGLYYQWGANRKQGVGVILTDLPEVGSREKSLCVETIRDHLQLRYGPRWQKKVRIFLVTGSPEDTESAAPRLSSEHWQEAEGCLLVYGGDAQLPPDENVLSVLRQLRPRQPVTGIVQIVHTDAFPDEQARDACIRYRQKADQLLGWQAPVWLWLPLAHQGFPEGGSSQAVAALSGPGCTPEALLSQVDALVPRLRQVGMTAVLNDLRHDGLLSLSSRLRDALRSDIKTLVTGVLGATAPYRLRGLVFSPAQTRTASLPHSAMSSPGWQTIAQDSVVVRARKITADWRTRGKAFLLALIVLWGAGTGLSLAVNRTQIYLVQKTASQAADTHSSLAVRLHHQMALQQAIARLQYREARGAPWYTRFGLNQDHDTLAALWPLYARNNTLLMRDATAQQLIARLRAFVRLPPASDARTKEAQQAYGLLKDYLMMSRPDKADAAWMAKYILTAWPQRDGVPAGTWQTLAPSLAAFWGQNLAAHPEWAVTPNRELVGTVRQILLKQIGQHNADSGLYQQMLKQIASNWPDLTLADMTGDTDASSLFSTDEVVPGMFTRQAWESQVQSAIDNVVKSRRDEIDWVLTDKAHKSGGEVSPEALKARLTERYFTDFGNAWLGMLNSIRWHPASSLSGAMGQLNLLSDARQSPLVALMNTLSYQGKTGQKGGALADSLVDSAKKLMGKVTDGEQFAAQARGPEGPLDGVFGPLLGLMGGHEGVDSGDTLSFGTWLTRVTQLRLKLQQVTSAPDPQEMAQGLARAVFQGKSGDLTDTRDYGSLVAASLGQAWGGFGQALFVQPLDLAWRQVLAPAAGGLNARWQSAIVRPWNTAFTGRYPFSATGSDASLPMLAQFLRADTGRISTFLHANLGGMLRLEGNRWVVDPAASQGMRINPAFLSAVNQLTALSDIVFAGGDAGVHFELLPRPSKDVARMQLTVDGQQLDYFNQMESWQSFAWPGDTYSPGETLSWQSNHNGGLQLYDSQQGVWSLIRLLEKARTTPLDSSRTQLLWLTTDGHPLSMVLRSELGGGPLALLELRNFRLPETIFAGGHDAVSDKHDASLLSGEDDE